MNIVRRLRQREKGSILGMAAISMTAILLAAGLAIDVGHWYLVGGELQNAADAAALAAASALDSTAGGITQAVTRATNTVNQYEFSGVNATIDNTNTNIKFSDSLATLDSGGGWNAGEAQSGTRPKSIKFVKVTVPPKSVSVFLAQIVTNSATISLSRSAVAGQSVELNTVCNVAPFSVVEYNTGDATTQYLNSPDCPNTKQFTRGCTYVVQSEPGNGVSAGNYQLLSFNGNRGGSTLRDMMAIGSAGCVSSGSTVGIYQVTGQKTGPVSDGVNTRFNQYSAGLTAAQYPPDANIRENITYAQYYNPSFLTSPSGNTGVWGRRVMVVPIVPVNAYSSGASGPAVTISKFGAFFLRSSVPNGNGNGGGITAEYIGDAIALGNGSFVPGAGTGFQGLTVAVLYR